MTARRLNQFRDPDYLGKLVVALSTGGAIFVAASTTAIPAFALGCSNIDLRKMLLDDMNLTPHVQSGSERMVDISEPRTITSDRGGGNLICSYLISASRGGKMRMRFSISKNSLGQTTYKIVQGD